DFTPSVNWGGTLVGTPSVAVQLVSRSGGVSKWQVVGSAVYAEEGTYNVSVTVNDEGGSSASTGANHATFTVSDAALTAGALTPPASLPATNLLAYYPLQGNAADNGGNGRNGTFSPNPPTATASGYQFTAAN